MNTPYITEARISALKQTANAVIKRAIDDLRHKKTVYKYKQDAYFFLKNLDDWFLVDACELSAQTRASISKLVAEYEKNNKL